MLGSGHMPSGFPRVFSPFGGFGSIAGYFGALPVPLPSHHYLCLFPVSPLIVHKKSSCMQSSWLVPMSADFRQCKGSGYILHRVSPSQVLAAPSIFRFAPHGRTLPTSIWRNLCAGLRRAGIAFHKWWHRPPMLGLNPSSLGFGDPMVPWHAAVTTFPVAPVAARDLIQNCYCPPPPHSKTKGFVGWA